MVNIILIELYKIFSKGRSFIGLGAVALLVSVLMLGIYFDGQHMLNAQLGPFRDNFLVQGNLLNCYFVSQLLLNTLWIHIPFLVVLVTGDVIAGEANAGTFRILISRPVSRIKLILGKFFSGFVYSTCLILILALISLGLGRLIFGTGDLIVLNNGFNIFEEGDIIWRFMCAFGFAILSMATIASLSYLFSVFSNNSIGPIIASMAVLIIFNIITFINFKLFDPIKPFLFTSYLNSWLLFFDYTLDFKEIFKSVFVLFGHMLLFCGVTLFIFKKKDILT